VKSTRNIVLVATAAGFCLAAMPTFAQDKTVAPGTGNYSLSSVTTPAVGSTGSSPSTITLPQSSATVADSSAQTTVVPVPPRRTATRTVPAKRTPVAARTPRQTTEPEQVAFVVRERSTAPTVRCNGLFACSPYVTIGMSF